MITNSKVEIVGGSIPVNFIPEKMPTWRDELAKAAMQGLVSGITAHHGHESHHPCSAIADEAYEMADAMLEARKAK
jgi:hypothetical protein